TNPVTGSTTNHATLNPFTNGGFTEDSTKDLGITSATDQWVHVAMVWDATNLLTYVNGALKITTVSSDLQVTALATAQSTVIIGCNPSNKNCFNGNFAEFRVWNVARTATEIQSAYKKSLAGNEAGLVGYWKFDDAAGAATAADSVTTAAHTAHPGTLKASSTALPTFVTATPPVPLVCP
ncbi:MAG TPA: LamG domain-containing protein, partial [Polyangiaceae bacterium]